MVLNSDFYGFLLVYRCALGWKNKFSKIKNFIFDPHVTFLVAHCLIMPSKLLYGGQMVWKAFILVLERWHPAWAAFGSFSFVEEAFWVVLVRSKASWAAFYSNISTCPIWEYSYSIPCLYCVDQNIMRKCHYYDDPFQSYGQHCILVTIL